MKSVSLNEKDFNEYIDSITEEHIVFGPEMKTNSTMATYFHRYFVKGGQNVKLYVNLKDIPHMNFRILSSQDKSSSGPGKLKCSFLYDPNNHTHRSLMKIEELTIKAIETVYGKRKAKVPELNGFVQKQMKVKEQGFESIKEVPPRFWITMPTVDKKQNADICKSKIIIATYNGKDLKTDTFENMKTTDLAKRCEFGAKVKSCSITFDNFCITKTGLNFSTIFSGGFSAIILFPHPRRENEEEKKMLEELREEIIENGTINAVEPEFNVTPPSDESYN